MPKYKVILSFGAWVEKEVEADNQEEALKIMENNAGMNPLHEWWDNNIQFGDDIWGEAEEVEE